MKRTFRRYYTPRVRKFIKIVVIIFIVLLVLMRFGFVRKAKGLGTRIYKFLHPKHIERASLIRLCSNDERKNYLAEMCEHTREERASEEKPHSRFVYSAKDKIIYCEVSKAACSTLKAIVADYSMNDTDKQRMDARGIHSIAYLNQTNLTLTGMWLPEFDHYTKILVVRNPFDRIMSAFYNLRHFVGGIGMHGPGGEVRRRIKERFRIQLEELTFQQFADFITQKGLSGKNYYDRHFRSFSKQCQVCDIKYDYIMRTESLSADAVPLLKQWGFSESYMQSLRLHDQTRPGHEYLPEVNTYKHLKEMRAISPEVYARLKSRYKYDMRLFGYHIGRDGKASCEISTTNNETCC